MQTWEAKIIIREEGREEGRAEARTLLLTAVQNVMQKLSISAENAIDILGIPEDEGRNLLDLLRDRK